jgi:large subunit ribosomal protein L3
MLDGMIGRKLGMVSLYTPDGRARACTAIELGPNWVTQVRSVERDGYEAIQLGFTGARKRVNQPERGHLRRAGVDTPLTRLREFKADEVGTYALGQLVPVTEFVPGEFVHVTGVSKGRGFAGGVKRWHFRGGPKTHGQSDRHRAPGSVGAGTTPGRTWRGQKMAGHMGARQRTVMNLLVIAVDEARGLLFVEGSVPGATNGLITVTRGRRKALAGFAPAELRGAAVVEEDEALEVLDEAEASDADATSEANEATAEPAAESEGDE